MTAKWTKPAYPGDTAMIRFFRLKGEIGDVRIQWIDHGVYKVGAFLPGVIQQCPGDTMKCWPDDYQEAFSVVNAIKLFEERCDKAREQGWEEFDPKAS